MSGRSFIFILLLHFAFGSMGYAQEPASIQLMPKDGLPSRTIYRITQDINGYIWIGTENGLSRYDGENFKNFHHPNFRDTEILNLQADAFGRIWFINLSYQLFYLENETIHEIDLSVIPDFLSLRDFTFTEEHLIVYFKKKDHYPSEGQMAYFSLNVPKDKIKIHVYPEVFKLCSAMETRGNKLYFSDLNKIITFNIDKDHSVSIKKNEATSDWIETIESYNYFKHDNGNRTKIYCYLDRIKTKKNTLKDFNYSAFAINDQLWFLTKNGIYHFNKESDQFELLLFDGKNCNTVFKDREGNIWVGTNKEGIFLIKSLALQKYNEQNSVLKVGETHEMLSDTIGKQLILGGSNGKIARINSLGQIKNYPPISHLDIRTISQDYSNNIWFITDRSLIKSTRDLTQHQSSKFSGLKTMIHDSKSQYWLGYFDRTFRASLQDLDKLHVSGRYNHLAAPLDQRTYAIIEDKSRNIWIGTTNGLYYLEDSLTLSSAWPKKILPHNITQIVNTKDSSLWVGTAAEGIFQIRDHKIVDTLTTFDGLLSNTCKDLLTHGDSLWIATNKGLNLLNIKTKKNSTINLFGNNSYNEINDMAVFNDQLWIANPNGLLTFPLSMNHRNKVPPLVHIDKIKIWDQDTTIQDTLHLKHDQNNLQIDFVGLGFRSSKNISYKYRLENIDSDWVTTKSKTVRYPSIKSGNYLFEVVAFNEDGIPSTVIAKVRFIIALPWWKTWWAIFIGIALLSILVLFIFSRRIKRIRKSEKLKQIFTEKVNELRHEALQTQMNPHFIFNALNAIQHFITNQDEEPALQYLSRFARLIRMIFEFSKMKEITIAEETSFLKNYLQLEKLRFQDKVTVDFQVDTSLQDADMEIRIPPLLIQPIIENAFKHGLFHRNGNGVLHIQLSKSAAFIICKIEDNGIGRHSARQKKIWINEHQKSSGLNNVRERLAILNNRQTNSTENDLEIIDLKDSSGKGIGTKVILKIKYSK